MKTKRFNYLLRFYFETVEYRLLFEIPLIINGGENIWSITKETIEVLPISTPQKMKFSIEDFFSKYDQIRMKLRIWLNLLEKS